MDDPAAYISPDVKCESNEYSLNEARRTWPDRAVKLILAAPTSAECAAFSAGFKRRYLNFVLLEGDEGRLSPGLKSATIKFLYNRVLMPVVYAMFRRDERKRTVAAP